MLSLDACLTTSSKPTIDILALYIRYLKYIEADKSSGTDQ